ncbi:MAG: hypothetical protein FWG34_05065 [Oscillospiraceae bacterium]|nr:hypothetical protein [Oscillospiraceae bacterium]
MDGEKKEVGDYLFDWKRKFDNFWYHYKFVLLIAVAVLAFVIFCVVQCASKIKGDVNIAYIGGTQFDSEMYGDLQRSLDEILGEDYNGDGQVHAEFMQFVYMTDIQMENARARGQPVNIEAIITAQTQIELEFAAGNIVIYFIDREIYKQYAKRGGLFMALEDALGYVPEEAYDGYAVKLGSLQCWEYYLGLDNFPKETVIAIRELKVSEEDDEKIQELYRRNLAMFKRLMEFKYKDEDKKED